MSAQSIQNITVCLNKHLLGIFSVNSLCLFYKTFWDVDSDSGTGDVLELRSPYLRDTENRYRRSTRL